MSKPNKIEAEIPKLYKRSAFHLLFYGFINGVSWSTPSISKSEAISAFIKRFKLSDEYTPNELLNTLLRIEKDEHEMNKTKKS